MNQRIGLFGGCFNPVHNGHLAAARAAQKHLALDRVIFIPSGYPPLKGSTGLLPGRQRLTMLELALMYEPAMETCAIEIDRDGPSFTVDTVRELRTALPQNSELYFLLGADCLGRLPQWKGIDEIHAMLKFAILPRGKSGTELDNDRLIAVPMPTLAVSSTLVRDRNSRGEPVTDLVPAAVAAYLQQERCYSCALQPAGANL